MNGLMITQLQTISRNILSPIPSWAQLGTRAVAQSGTLLFRGLEIRQLWRVQAHHQCGPRRIPFGATRICRSLLQWPGIEMRPSEPCFSPPPGLFISCSTKGFYDRDTNQAERCCVLFCGVSLRGIADQGAFH